MTTLRILITGSRTWPKPFWVEEIISDYMTENWEDENGEQNDFVLVHGAAKSGADAQGDRSQKRLAATGWPIVPDPHPADWKKYGKPAGFIRNEHMVSLGADVCIAFIHNESKGATDCANRAKAKGIPVQYVIFNK